MTLTSINHLVQTLRSSLLHLLKGLHDKKSLSKRHNHVLFPQLGLRSVPAFGLCSADTTLAICHIHCPPLLLGLAYTTSSSARRMALVTSYFKINILFFGFLGSPGLAFLFMALYVQRRIGLGCTERTSR
jgi:hypothetical protein